MGTERASAKIILARLFVLLGLLIGALPLLLSCLILQRNVFSALYKGLLVDPDEISMHTPEHKIALDKLEAKLEEKTRNMGIVLDDLAQENESLIKKSERDALTGVFNRAYFDRRYTQEFKRSRRDGTPLSIIFVDIDHFKQVNDNYGHLVGDECIKYVATVLSQEIKREADAACRYGGEEFALIIPNTSEDNAFALAESLRCKVVENTQTFLGEEVSLSVSCGLVTRTVDNEVSELQLLDMVDKALYQSKQNGRNRVTIAP